jgi:hypothetical protein
MVVVSNPIGALNELSQLLEIPVVKSFSQIGEGISIRFVCRLTFSGRQFDSPASQTKEEAYKHACSQLLELLPFTKVPQECLAKSGEAHQLRFRGEFENLKTPWFSRLNDASKHLLKMVVNQHFGGQDLSLAGLSLAEDSTDLKVTQMVKNLVHWQDANLPKLRFIFGLKDSKELNGYLTAAFITPGFCLIQEERDAVSNFLGIPESSYERLETLGDAIIYLAGITKNFDSGVGPGDLSMRRQSLINEQALVKCMTKLGLDELIIFRDRYAHPTTKVISDIFEALVAAVWKSCPEDRHVCGERMLSYITP